MNKMQTKGKNKINNRQTKTHAFLLEVTNKQETKRQTKKINKMQTNKGQTITNKRQIKPSCFERLFLVNMCDK